MEAELWGIPAGQVLRVNLRLAAVLAKLEKSEELRRQIRARAGKLRGEVDLVLFDGIETYALAAFAASNQAELSNPPPLPLAPQVKELKRVRDLICVDLEGLEKFGLLQLTDERRRRARGAAKIASEVIAKVQLLESNWVTIEERSHLDEEDLAAAVRLALAVQLGHQVRKDRTRPDPRSVDLKHRAFTLLIRAYTEVRRVVAFLCWDKPALLALVPALHAEEKRPRRKTGEASQATPTQRRTKRKSQLSWAEKLQRQEKRRRR